MPVMRPPQSPDSGAKPSVAEGTANAEGGRVTLRFTGEAWVKVREKNGPTVIDKIMKAGDTFAVPSRPNLVLNTGNAPRVEILVDGVPVPALSGMVRTNVTMDPEQLKAGAATSPATPGRNQQRQ